MVKFGGLECRREGKSGRFMKQRFRNGILLGSLVETWIWDVLTICHVIPEGCIHVQRLECSRIPSLIKRVSNSVLRVTNTRREGVSFTA